MRRLLLLGLVSVACREASQPLRLGTTYTVQQSGALTVVESLWTGPRLVTVIAPSGQILRSAASGDLDVVITHAPALSNACSWGPDTPCSAARSSPVGSRSSARPRIRLAWPPRPRRRPRSAASPPPGAPSSRAATRPAPT